MKILVTGAYGFVGKNLISRLKNTGYEDIMEYDRESSDEDLRRSCREAGIVFHLAGVNRPRDNKEFISGNTDLTKTIVSYLEEAGNNCPIIITSSIQAESSDESNVYASSKRGAEQALYQHGKNTGAKVIIYRMPNIFGKWSRPNYNSAVATFCRNTARSLPIQVNDPEHMMHLVYIDDVVTELIEDMEMLDEGREPAGTGEPYTAPRCTVYDVKLGYIADTILSFPKLRESRGVPVLSDELTSKLYSTYLSFLPEDAFSYKLKMNKDDRGSFTEFIRTPDRGQVSVNISHPGIAKGNHWHDSKNEKFLVVKGKGLIRFRKVGTDEIIDYHVSDEELTVVDIPTGYVHCIINEGDEDMVTLMWASEAFDPARADTYRENV